MNTVSGREIAPSLVSQFMGRFSWRDAKCLYMLSTGRTGSTAVSKLLNLCEEFQAYHELAPRGAMTYRDVLLEYDELPKKYERYFVRHRAGVIGAIHRRSKVFAETNNFQFYAPMISQLLPRSQFVYIHRHPAEYVRSGMRRGWYLNHSWDAFRLHPRGDSDAGKRWQNWTQFEKICWFWNEVNDFFLRFRSSQPASRVATIPFVELVNPETGAYRKLFECVGLPPPSEAAAAPILTAKVNAQEAGDFPKYADWTSDQLKTLRQMAGETMASLGYA